MARIGVNGVTLDMLWNVNINNLKNRCFLDIENGVPQPRDDYC